MRYIDIRAAIRENACAGISPGDLSMDGLQ